MICREWVREEGPWGGCQAYTGGGSGFWLSGWGGMGRVHCVIGWVQSQCDANAGRLMDGGE